MTTVHLENENAQLKNMMAKLHAQLLIERLMRKLHEKRDGFSREDLEVTITDVVGSPK